jgi:hopanoid biosynthesis associated protein HpnK
MTAMTRDGGDSGDLCYSLSLPRLIINADDFGLTSGVNRAIAEAGHAGRLTSATIMANAPAFAEATALAKELPRLKTGCHVVLIDGKPIVSDLPTLAPGGEEFRSSLKEFARAAWRGKIAASEVQREAEAQIRKIQSAGIVLTHVDSHKHTHLFPSVLRPVLRAAKACGIRGVRNPFEPLRSWPGGLVATTPGLWLRSAAVAAFGFFAADFRKAIQEEGMLTTEGTVGIAVTGLLDQKKLLTILQALPEGTWELVCHPGYADDDLKASGTRLVQSRQVEFEALASAETRKTLAARGIELISYADLSH